MISFVHITYVETFYLHRKLSACLVFYRVGIACRKIVYKIFHIQLHAYIIYTLIVVSCTTLPVTCPDPSFLSSIPGTQYVCNMCNILLLSTVDLAL